MHIYLTGASGRLGRVLVRGLSEAGHTLTLSDVAPFPDALPPGARFEQADVADAATTRRLADGAQAIVHFGGVATDEPPAEAVVHANITGANAVFEAAKAHRARVVFASSNHAIGFHERSETLAEDCELRPDSYYGLSKAYTELLGRLFFDKHGIESAHLRIGSCEPEPKNDRHLSTWLSYPDLVGLVRACCETPTLGWRIVWGCSNNRRKWWTSRSWAEIGYTPKDDSEAWAGKVGGPTHDAVAERFQGGPYTSNGWSRG